MTFRSWSSGWLAGIVLLAASGCASPYAYYGDECGGGAGLFSGRYADGSCGDCGCGNCGKCGDCGTAACDSFEAHTLTGTLRQSATCGGGCGELYLGEWTYDPPDACDPCGNHGDWIGERCCPPRGLALLSAGLVGQRCSYESSDCGCDECATEWGDSEFQEPEAVYYDGLSEYGTSPQTGTATVPPSASRSSAGPIPSVRRENGSDWSARATTSRDGTNRNPQSRLIRRPRR
jgi:hypothetical protein